MIVRKRLFYRGRVQGVGFRATCRSLAAGQGVGGSVRNLADGRVELVLEGESADVQAVIEAVAARMPGYVREATEESEPPRGERNFRIEH